MTTPDPPAQRPGTGEPARPENDGRHPRHAARRQHPTVLAQQEERASSAQLRIADWITAFAGSMRFIYIHIAFFTVWMVFIESNPWPTLTLIVSMEAIFLSTFVLIGQNRQAAFQQAKADHDFNDQELELKTNTDLTRDIHRLTSELYRRLSENPGQRGSL